jgi:23S rRNA maturation-related 3'-5' exoribonuclease YhaM
MNIMEKALEQIDEGEFTNRQFALEDRCLYKPYTKEKK